MRDLAVRTPDSGFLKPRLVRFVTSAERDEILAHVRATLLPNLETCIDNWKDNFPGREDPESYFSSLEDDLKEYKKAVSADAIAVALIDDGLARIETAVEDCARRNIRSPRWRVLRGEDSPRGSTESRSIFDDVDE